MFSDYHLDDPRVFAFVCVALLCAVIVPLVLLFRRASRTTSVLSDSSVSVSKISRSQAYVTYRHSDKKIEFPASVGPGHNIFIPRIDVLIPESILQPELQPIIDSLCVGLKDLGYEYVLYRKGTPFMIPETDRQAAIAELRLMGFEFDRSDKPEGVNRAVAEKWPAEEAKEILPKVMKLMSIASGVRPNVEILASRRNLRPSG